MTIAPRPSAPPASTVAPAAEPSVSAQTLPPVIVTAKPDAHKETRALLKEIIEKGPELVGKMTPEEVEEYRLGLHSMMVGGGTAETLVGMAEMANEAGKLMREELTKPDAPDPEEDVAEDLPVTHGQIPQFADLLKRMTCRAADQRLTEETEIDKNRVEATRNSGEGQDAERDLKKDRVLRQRLDLACQP